MWLAVKLCCLIQYIDVFHYNKEVPLEMTHCLSTANKSAKDVKIM